MHNHRVLVLLMLFVMTSAHAEYFGLPGGRSADLSRMPDSSVEFGFVTGDIPTEFDEADYQNIGGRFNYRTASEWMVYFDIGLSEIEDFDGTPFGIGAFYQMDGVFDGADFAIKGSYHTGSFDENNREIDVDAIAVEGVFSGREPVGNNNMTWYANLGIHRLKAEADGGNSDSETEFGFGGGVVIPSDKGELFAGVDLIDEISFGIGYRYFLQ